MKDIYCLKHSFYKDIKSALKDALDDYLADPEVSEISIFRYFFEKYSDEYPEEIDFSKDWRIIVSLIKTTERRFKVTYTIRPISKNSENFLYVDHASDFKSYLDFDNLTLANPNEPNFANVELAKYYNYLPVSFVYISDSAVTNLFFMVIPKLTCVRSLIDELGNLVVSFNFCYDFDFIIKKENKPSHSNKRGKHSKSKYYKK